MWEVTYLTLWKLVDAERNRLGLQRVCSLIKEIGAVADALDTIATAVCTVWFRIMERATSFLVCATSTLALGSPGGCWGLGPRERAAWAGN
jgi:hypothetical protein